MMSNTTVYGAGLGYRRSMGRELLQPFEGAPDFLEIAPENWLNVGGRFGKLLREHTERYPFAAHGLSLSIGSPAALDEAFVKAVGQFLKQHQISIYSEHLSYCSDHGHLYDLMPIPFTEEAVDYVAERVRRVQEILGQRLILENVSFYTPLASEMTELEFVTEVIRRADAEMLLDVNNVYVNSVNHGYDPYQFIDQVDAERVRYFHVAGHYVEAEDLIVDTHGADVIDPVWDLLRYATNKIGARPTLLERDFNIPAVVELRSELDQIREIQQSAMEVLDERTVA